MLKIKNLRLFLRRSIDWFLGTPSSGSDSYLDLPPIRVRVPFGGKIRLVRLIGKVGFNAQGQTCDEGPATIVLVRRGMVQPGYKNHFDRFMEQA